MVNKFLKNLTESKFRILDLTYGIYSARHLDMKNQVLAHEKTNSHELSALVLANFRVE